MDDADAIGIVRQHRRVSAKGQREALEEDGCRVILEIGDRRGKQHKREDIERLVRPGSVVKLLHVFLLADPSKARSSGKRKDLLDTMARIEKRGGTIKDVASGLITSEPDKRYAMIALATDQLARDGKGLRSRNRNYQRLGRPVRVWTPEEWRDAKHAWENRKLKTWADVKAMLPEGMSLSRAWRAFGGRDVQK